MDQMGQRSQGRLTASSRPHRVRSRLLVRPCRAVVSRWRGSGFAITLPEKWIVKLVEPDPDIYTAAPGATWEALRAHEPGRSRACSVYVGIVPLDAGPVGESAAVDTDVDATDPYWSAGGRPTLVVPPVRYRQRSGSGSEMVSGWPRPRADDARLSHDVVYVVTCAADGDRDSREIADSFEILASER